MPFILRRLSYLLCLFLIASLVSCNSSRDFEKIPADASMVVAVDFKNIALNAFSLRTLFQKDTSTGKTDKTGEFDKTGIDFTGKALAFKLSENQGSSRFYFSIPISDEQEFVDFMKTRDKTIVKTNSLDMDWISGKGILFGIKDHFAVGMYDPYMNNDTRTKTKLKGLFSLSDEQKLVNANPEFNEFTKKSADAGIWIDIGKVTESTAIPAQTLNLSGSQMVGYLDFTDGKISFDGEFINPDSMAKEYARIVEKQVEATFLEQIPSKKPIGLIAFRLDMPVLKKIIESNPQWSLMAQSFQSFGFSPDDVFEMLEGQISIAALEVPQMGQFIPNMTMQLSVQNREKAVKVLKGMASNGLVREESPAKFVVDKMPGLEIELTDNLLDIHNSVPQKDRFSTSNIPDFPEGNSLAFFDFKEIAKAIPEGFPQKQQISEFSSYWDSMVLSSGFVTETKSRFSVQIRSTRTDENAFLTSLQYVNVLKRDYDKFIKSNQGNPYTGMDDEASNQPMEENLE